MTQDPELQQEFDRTRLVYGASIAIGVVMVQQFLTAPSLDLSARICVVAFSVAIPVLVGLLAINWHEISRRHPSKSVFAAIAEVVAQVCTFAGVVAGFWHITWIAGVGVLAGTLVASVATIAGIMSIEKEIRSQRLRESANPAASRRVIEALTSSVRRFLRE